MSSHFHVFFIGVLSSLVMSSGGVLCSRSLFGVPRNKLKIEQNMKYEKYLNILVDPT